MCGIFGFVSSPPAGREVALEGYFEAIDSLLALGAVRADLEGVTEAEEKGIRDTLRAALAMTYRWVGREGFLAVLRDKDLQRRLDETASRVRSWATELSDLSQSAGLERQRDRELINQLIVGAKDIAWQLQRDCLENLDPVRRVVRIEDDASPPERLLGHAWQLGLVLSGVNRLEVRGRDSAGIAVYARFPGVGSLESFLDGPAGGVGWRQESESRASGGALIHFSVVRPTGRDDTLLFVFKVANEIGKMGDNVAFLRAAIIDDRLFQAVLREADVDIQCLAHTRWASNGIISESNCHPVDSACYAVAPGSDVQPGTPRTLEESGQILAVLNGDIDNYQELLGVYLDRLGGAIDPTITTDAKIIPLAVNYHFRQSGDLLEAFHRAFAEFEGSMAIGVMAADRPGEFVFGQKGSGQGLYLGVSDDTISVASEMYGIVEFSQRYIKAEPLPQAVIPARHWSQQRPQQPTRPNYPCPIATAHLYALSARQNPHRHAHPKAPGRRLMRYCVPHQLPGADEYPRQARALPRRQPYRHPFCALICDRQPLTMRVPACHSRRRHYRLTREQMRSRNYSFKLLN